MNIQSIYSGCLFKSATFLKSRSLWNNNTKMSAQIQFTDVNLWLTYLKHNYKYEIDLESLTWGELTNNDKC